MALSINTHPTDVVTNAPEFNVTTSLTEGASYQNVRVRATIYIGGQTEAVAVLEQPKGVNDWDLFDVLKSFCGKMNHEVGGTDTYIGPTLSSELLTGWSEYNGFFTTFSTSGRQIINAVTTTSPDWAESNDLGTAAIGDVYLVSWEEDYSDIGSEDVFFVMAQGGAPDSAYDLNAKFAGLTGAGKYSANKFCLFCMPYADTTPFVFLGSNNSSTQFDGTFSVKKISDFKGNPGVYFTVKFQEVYENSSDVTTISDTEYAQSLLFMPVRVRPGETWDDFYANGSAGRLLTRADNEAAAMYKYNIGMELRVLFCSAESFTRVTVIADAGSPIVNNIQNCGWGMAIANDTNLSIDAQDETVGFTVSAIVNGGGILYTIGSMSVNCETRCFKNAIAIGFVGELGEETILFRGRHTETGQAEKTYYKNVQRVRRVLSAFKRTRLKLRSLVETVEIRRLMHEAVYTEFPVWSNHL
jgi:hypothetical protein